MASNLVPDNTHHDMYAQHGCAACNLPDSVKASNSLRYTVWMAFIRLIVGSQMLSQQVSVAADDKAQRLVQFLGMKFSSNMLVALKHLLSIHAMRNCTVTYRASQTPP